MPSPQHLQYYTYHIIDVDVVQCGRLWPCSLTSTIHPHYQISKGIHTIVIQPSVCFGFIDTVRMLIVDKGSPRGQQIPYWTQNW